MTEEELDRMWADSKACDKRRAERYNALPEAEKKRLEKKFSDPFYERISENPFGDDFGDDNKVDGD